MGKKSRDYLDGSYTVEAAFIIPMILGIVYAWIFMIFYLHDQVVTCGLMQEAAISEKEVWHRPGVEQKRIEAEPKTQQEPPGIDLYKNPSGGELQKRIQSYLWVVKSDRVRKKKGLLYTKFVMTGKASWDIPVMHAFLGDMTSKVTVKTENIRPVTLLRAGLYQSKTGNDKDNQHKNDLNDDEGEYSIDGVREQ